LPLQLPPFLWNNLLQSLLSRTKKRSRARSPAAKDREVLVVGEESPGQLESVEARTKARLHPQLRRRRSRPLIARKGSHGEVSRRRPVVP
jgi:hypothetical protein